MRFDAADARESARTGDASFVLLVLGYDAAHLRGFGAVAAVSAADR